MSNSYFLSFVGMEVGNAKISTLSKIIQLANTFSTK